MKIAIALSAQEIAIASAALDEWENNEHDKGSHDELWQDDVWGAAKIALQDAMVQNMAGNPVVRVQFDASAFGLLSDVVEIFCTDPADEQDATYEAQIAFARRLASLPTIEV